MSSIVPSPFSRLATAVVSGLVSTAAQTFAGVKTFAALLVASAGIQVASLFNTNGTGAGDVAVKIGVSTSDASVNASAKLAEWYTGIGGTEVAKAHIRKSGAAWFGGANGVAIGNAADLYNVASGVKYDSGTGLLALFNVNNAAHIGIAMGTGAASCSGSFTAGGNMKTGNGTASATAFGPSGDADTGLWFPASDTINLVTNGTLRSQWTSTGALAHQGPMSMPTNSLFSIGASSFYERTTGIIDFSGVLQLNSGSVAKPAATAANRGALWYSKSAPGAADTVEICLKSAANTYSWVVIATG